MLKMRIFWKTLKIASASGAPLASGGWGVRPQTPALWLLRTITTFVSSAACVLLP